MPLEVGNVVFVYGPGLCWISAESCFGGVCIGVNKASGMQHSWIVGCHWKGNLDVRACEGCYTLLMIPDSCLVR
jgi:hypothetical protein